MLKQFLDNRRGSSVLQLPIAVLILTCLIVFSFVFGQAFYEKTVMRAAVREGAREYQVSMSQERALERAQREIQVGGVRNVALRFEGGTVVARKSISFGIPALGWYPFSLETEAGFREEMELDYYDREGE